MSELPTNDVMLENLVRSGDPLNDTYKPIELNRRTFFHPEKKRSFPITVDERVLAASGIVYANGPGLVDALKSHGAKKVYSHGRARDMFFKLTMPIQSELLLGFVGFASAYPGVEYSQEAEGIKEIFTHLDNTRSLPALAINGASRPGVLGLSTLFAREYNVTTLGIVPFEGLKNSLPQDHLMVWGRTYAERERMVGTWPDAVIATGGAAGTLHECEFAARYGSAVMLYAPKEYAQHELTKTFMESSDLAQAAEEKRLVVCRPNDALPEKLDELIAITDRTNKLSRKNRRIEMKNLTRPLRQAIHFTKPVES